MDSLLDNIVQAARTIGGSFTIPWQPLRMTCRSLDLLENAFWQDLATSVVQPDEPPTNVAPRRISWLSKKCSLDWQTEGQDSASADIEVCRLYRTEIHGKFGPVGVSGDAVVDEQERQLIESSFSQLATGLEEGTTRQVRVSVQSRSSDSVLIELMLVCQELADVDCLLGHRAVAAPAKHMSVHPPALPRGAAGVRSPAANPQSPPTSAVDDVERLLGRSVISPDSTPVNRRGKAAALQKPASVSA